MTMKRDKVDLEKAGVAGGRVFDPGDCATVSLVDAAQLLGIHRSTAWDLHRRGQFPVPVLRIGHGLRVAKVQLERFLLEGEEPRISESIM